MKGIAYFLVAVAVLTGVVVYMAHASGHADEEAAPIFGIKIPPGYRDWRLISVAHEEGNLNDLRAVLGNDVAIKAYREGKLPFPDGTIIARLAWSYVPSEENNKVFGRPQSFVAGPPRLISPVYGQGLKKVRRDGRLGFRSIQRRQTCRRGDAQNLLPLPRAGQSSGFCLHPLRTLIQSIETQDVEAMLVNSEVACVVLKDGWPAQRICHKEVGKTNPASSAWKRKRAADFLRLEKTDLSRAPR